MYPQKGGGQGVVNGKPGDTKDEPLVAGSPPGEDELVTEHEYVPFILRYSTLISRLFGVVVLTVLWSFTVLMLNDLSNYNAYAPWYLLVISLLTTFFELIWLFNKCITCRVGFKESQYDDSMSLTYDEADFSRKDNCCCKCWRLMLWMDNWRKALLYVVFGVPMFIHNLVTVYTVICGLVLLILAVLYFIKSFKESKCVARKPRKHSYVQTANSPKPKYVEHPVQTFTGDYAPASHGYDSLGHTKSIQPPEYTERQEQPKQPDHGANYFRPFKEGMGNVPDDPKETVAKTTNGTKGDPQGVKSPRRSTKQKEVAAHASSPASQKSEPEDQNKNIRKDTSKESHSSPKEGREKPKSSPTDESGFKLFGLLKKEDKPKEQVVTMVSSERSVEEDLEHYPDDKNPFYDDEDCEWDPNNRGQS